MAHCVHCPQAWLPIGDYTGNCRKLHIRILLRDDGSSSTHTSFKQRARQAVSPIAGTRSAYFPLAAVLRKRPVLTPVLAGITICIILSVLIFVDIDMHGFWFTVSLSVFYAGIGQPLREIGVGVDPSAHAVDTLANVNRLLSAAGYELIENPVSGDPAIDPLITSVDIVALAPDRGYAISISESDDTGLDWSRASELRTAARALEEVLDKDGSTQRKIEPLLLAIGAFTNDAIEAISAKIGIKLVRIKDSSLLSFPQDEETSRLKDVASELLLVPAAGEASDSLSSHMESAQ